MPFGRYAASAALACSLSALLSCGGDDGGTQNPPAPVTTVTVTPNPAQVQVGSTVQLTATLRDADGNTLTGRTVTWSSDATAVATVNSSGLATGVSAGSATITAASEGKTGTTPLTVTGSQPPPPATGTSGAFVGTGGKVPVSMIRNWDRLNREWYDITGVARAVSAATAANMLLGGPPPLSRVPWTAARAAEGNVVLFAGGDGADDVIAIRDALLYEPGTGTSTGLDMNEARIYHTMTKLSETQSLVTGGMNGTIGGTETTLASAEVFDLGLMQFTATGSMAVARSRHAAARLADGRVLITGGLAPASPGPGTIDVASAEIYDPAAGTFSPTGSMTVPRFNHSAVALDDGRVLVVGGNGRKSAEVYDPATGQFTAVEDMEVAHGLGHRAVKLLDGRVLVLGGDGGVIQPTAVVEIFDPATNQFTRTGDMTTTRMLHFAVLVEEDGTVLVGGGQDASGTVLESTESFDPATGTFSPEADLPLPGSEQAAVYVPE